MRTLSAGDVLRAHIRNGTEIGREAEGVVKRGGECMLRRAREVPGAEISGRTAVARSGFVARAQALTLLQASCRTGS
jgi:hypothetical protein